MDVNSGAGPLAERESELATLGVTAEAAARGEGRFVIVEGPAGIGKTRLLGELRARLRTVGSHRWLRARATEHESHAAYGVVRQLLEPTVRRLDDEQRGVALSGGAGPAGAVLGVDGEPEAVADPIAAASAIFWLLVELAREKPLVLAIDDLQWSDEPSLEVVSYLARRVEDVPVLLIAATRPPRESGGDLLAALLVDPAASVIRPTPLSEPSIAMLVQTALGSEPDPAFARASLEATRGNPFLLAELLRAAHAGGIRPSADGARELSSLAPDGLVTAIDQRLDRLPPGSRRIAEAVAVAGDGAEPGFVARLAEVETPDFGVAERALIDATILQPEAGLSFAHPIVRSTVLERISPSRRAALHESAYAVLRERGESAEVLAGHLLDVEPSADAGAVATLREAAAGALTAGAPATAVRYLERATREPPPPKDRADVLTELGHAESRAGAPGAVFHLREALGSELPAARVRAGLELARTLKFAGGAVEAVEVLEGLDEDLAAVPPELSEMVELEHLGLAYISAAARPRLAARVALLEDRGREPASGLEAFSLAALAFEGAFSGTRPAEEVAELAARSVAGERMPVNATDGGFGLLMAGVASMWSDRVDVAAAINERVLAEGRRQGSVVARTAAASMQALVEWKRGRVADADASASLALELSERTRGTQAMINAARAVIAWVALARGDDAARLAQIEDQVLSESEDTDALPHHLVLHARGLIRIGRGEVDSGLADLIECGRSVAWGATNPAIVPWRSDAALALARTGERERATELVAEELALAESFGAAGPIGVALRAAALIADGGPSAAGLEAAAEALERSPATLSLAVTLTDLAATQRSVGDRSTARGTAARAQDLAVRCGATALAARARDEALAAGARPRRVALRGVDSLTPSELRVARRAAEGDTNRDIAENLFVTVKTVEMHLKNAYGKLEISSRTQLPQALDSPA